MKELSEKQIQKAENKVSLLVEKADSFIVESKEDVTGASEFLKKIKEAEKRIEDKRLEFTKPLNQSLKAINDTFRKLKEPLGHAKRLLSDKVLSWRETEQAKVRIEEEKRRKIEEEKIRKIMEARKNAKSEEEKRELVEEIIESEEPKSEVEEPESTIGNTRARKVWSFKVMDFAKVPDKYKSINQVEVNADIRAGERDIAGLKIYQKEILTVV